MKSFYKWAIGAGVVLVTLIILSLSLKNPILRAVVERKFRSRTGLRVSIGKFSSGLFSPVVTMRDLKVYNTAAFGGTPFLDITELHMEFDPAALRQRKLHITLLKFNVSEVDVVRNRLGQTNVITLLHPAQPAGSGATNAAPAVTTRQLLGDFKFAGIDVLDLTVTRAKYVDLGDPRNDRETVVDLRNQTFKDVKSKGDLYGVMFILWLRSGGNFALKPPRFNPGPTPSKTTH